MAQAVFKSGKVSYHRVIGGILLYLLVAIMFGTLFIFVGLLWPDAFKGSHSPMTAGLPAQCST